MQTRSSGNKGRRIGGLELPGLILAMAAKVSIRRSIAGNIK
jgi:hypothetical protein